MTASKNKVFHSWNPCEAMELDNSYLIRSLLAGLVCLGEQSYIGRLAGVTYSFHFLTK